MKLCGYVSTDAGKKIELTELDARFIEYIRQMGYGEIHITIRKGLPHKAVWIGASVLFEEPLGIETLKC